MKALIRGRDTVLGTHEFKVHGLVRRAGGRGHRGGQDPAPVSAGELLRRTLRDDRPDRGHRPHADLRRATPAPSACRVRRPLQHRAAASGTAVAAAAPDITGCRAGSWRIRRRPILGGLLDEYEMRLETAGQAPCPRSGTPQGFGQRVPGVSPGRHRQACGRLDSTGAGRSDSGRSTCASDLVGGFPAVRSLRRRSVGWAP